MWRRGSSKRSRDKDGQKGKADNDLQSAVSKDPRVKLTVLFNSPVFGATNPKTLKNPIAYFLGGPSDMAQSMVSVCLASAHIIDFREFC
jgi:hypothetical protein